MNDRIIIRDTEIDLDPETVVARTLQINDMNAMDNRQGGYSNTVSVPMTAKNINTLHFANKLDSGTVLPYRKLAAKLIQGGTETIPNALAVIESSSDHFELTLYDSSIDFFNAIAQLKMSDLDLSDLDHIWSFANVVAFIPNTGGIIYPLVDDTTITVTGEYVYADRLYPYIFVHTLLERIAAAQGLTLRGAWIASYEYNNLLVSLNNGFDQKFLFALATNTATQNCGPTGDYAVFDTVEHDALYDKIGVRLIYQITTPTPFTFYNAYMSGSYSFRYVLYYISTSPSAFFQVVMVDLAATETIIKRVYIPSGSGRLVITVDGVMMEAGFNVKLFFQSTISGSIDLLEGSTMECTGVTSLASKYKLLYPINVNLPEITQKEFLKGIFQMFCLLPVVDAVRGTLTLHPFNEVAVNRARARDWSDKLDTTTAPLVKYHATGYAKVNWMRYKENSAEEIAAIVALGASAPAGDGGFAIDDDTLQDSKDLFTLPFAASGMALRLQFIGVQMPVIPRPEGVLDTPRVLLLDRQLTPAPVTYMDNTDIANVFINTAPESVCYFTLQGKTVNLAFANNLIPKYYLDWVNALSAFKDVTAYLNLTESDIAGYDGIVPVYIRSLGQYFYVNKIDQYIQGRPTACELIMLGGGIAFFSIRGAGGVAGGVTTGDYLVTEDGSVIVTGDGGNVIRHIRKLGEY